MTVPKFESVEEADKWFAAQARGQQQDDWLQAHDQAMRLGECVRWNPDDHTIVSYTKAKVGKTPRYVCVVRRSSATERGRVIYIRGFAKRKDAKERAVTEYWKWKRRDDAAKAKAKARAKK